MSARTASPGSAGEQPERPPEAGRRQFLGAGLAALPLASLLALGAGRPAHADVSRSPDVVVFCDPTLRATMHQLGAAFLRDGGAPVRLICAPAGIIAAQLARSERTDLVVTLEPVVRQMVAAQLVDLRTGVGAWRNRIVLAGLDPSARAGSATEPTPAPTAAPTGLDRLPELLGDGRLGAPDLTGNAVFDTPALLHTLGLDAALAGRVAGEVDTGGVAFLLRQGKVRLGLLLRTDARLEGFAERLAIPEAAYPPIRYGVAQNRHAMSSNTERFLAFLAAAPARDSLARGGLEIIA